MSRGGVLSSTHCPLRGGSLLAMADTDDELVRIAECGIFLPEGCIEWLDRPARVDLLLTGVDLLITGGRTANHSMLRQRTVIRRKGLHTHVHYGRYRYRLETSACRRFVRILDCGLEFQHGYVRIALARAESHGDFDTHIEGNSRSYRASRRRKKLAHKRPSTDD